MNLSFEENPDWSVAFNNLYLDFMGQFHLVVLFLPIKSRVCIYFGQYPHYRLSLLILCSIYEMAFISILRNRVDKF